MYKRVVQTLQHLFIPSTKNAYRPQVLHASWLLFFVALSLAAEGFLVVGMVAQPSTEVYLASAAATQPASISQARQITQNFERQSVRLLNQPEQPTDWVLSGVLSILAVALALAVVIHFDIQPTDMLLQGALVALFVLALIVANTHVLHSPAQDAESAAVSQSFSQ